MGSAGKGRLPDFIVIGAQKCGTTSLDYYFGLHPQIGMARKKELDFFVREMNGSKGVEWYRSHFDVAARVVGETSPNYTAHPRLEPVPRMAEVLRPETKFIYAVRDPIDRILSQYVHYYARGWEEGSLEDALHTGEFREDMLQRSRYYHQLSQYTARFPREQIHLITLEDLLHRRQETLAGAFAFLGVEPSFGTPLFRRRLHQGRHRRRLTPSGRRLAASPLAKAGRILPAGLRPQLEWLAAYPFSRAVPRRSVKPDTLAYLREALQEDADAFRRFSGLELKHWSV
jgi:hypothetical protein